MKMKKIIKKIKEIILDIWKYVFCEAFDLKPKTKDDKKFLKLFGCCVLLGLL
ncbi:MAG: hypothetical protein KJ569_02670 [Candidatus Omnitrophica bacterium]|nr:hypothetical protein [Candidatus Omnitrophota bacterium]MBU2505038.1 hypothetical protein [Candidatus Omnitrophota bacterium]